MVQIEILAIPKRMVLQEGGHSKGPEDLPIPSFMHLLLKMHCLITVA